MKSTRTGLLGAALTAVVLAHPDLATAAEQTTNLKIPLELTVEGATESLAVKGTLHVVTRVQGNSPTQDTPSSSVQVHTNLESTTAIGLTTGLTSPVIGSQSVDLAGAGVSDDVLVVLYFVLKEAVQEQQKVLQYYVKRLQILARLKFDPTGALTDVTFDRFPPPCD